MRSRLLVASVWLCGSYAAKCGKANKSSRKCVGKKYLLSEDLANAAELQLSLTVCRVLWDEIRRGDNRWSVPRENHSQCLRKQRIPARPFLCFGCHMGDMSWVQAGYKVEPQMLINTNKHRKANNKISYLDNGTTSANRKCPPKLKHAHTFCHGVRKTHYPCLLWSTRHRTRF